MDDGTKQEWAAISREHVRDCLTRISSGDPDAAFDLAQLLMARVAEQDVDVLLGVVEGLARQSAVLGSSEARAFLDSQWAGLKAVLKRRLNRTLGSSP